MSGLAMTNETQSRNKRGRPHKRKHDEVNGSGSNAPVVPNNELARLPQAEEEVAEKILATTRRKKERSKRRERSGRTTWKASETVGGLLADLLPMFSVDEECLLLAYSHSVKVYSVATSMLVRSCKTGGSTIASFCLSYKKPSRLYVLLEDSKIQLWDWTTGEKLKTWDLGAQVSDIAVAPLQIGSEAADTLFVAETRKGSSEITAHRLLDGEGTAAKSLYRGKDTIRMIRTLANGRFIVAVSSSSLIVGTRTNTADTKFKQLKFQFNTFEVPGFITCFDARVDAGVNSRLSEEGNLSIAVGLQDGSIRIYSEAAVSVQPNASQSSITPPNRKIHWHRQAVSSLGWGVDGNYLVSGGSESVLVLWQLDTGTHTTIPHLTSTVEAVTVSPKGSSYAVRLADNSVMMLATTDFTPTFNIAGLALPSEKPYVEALLNDFLPSRRAPVACTTSLPPRLISAVPSDIYRDRGDGEHRPGFYTNTNIQSTPLSNVSSVVSRQALVDNYSTKVRQRPDGKPLVAPHVVLLDATADGSWLAAVDEWYQPITDVLPNATHKDNASFKQLGNVEINLVFWHWDAAKEVWESYTRIADPHADTIDLSQPNNLVLDLVKAPNRNAFWTLGSDGRVKCWTPHKRSLIGSRATTTGSLISNMVWKCSQSIVVPKFDFTKNKEISARLSISKDGSLFNITTVSSSGTELIVFAVLPDNTCKIMYSMKSEYRGLSVAFLDQYLIVADYESVIVRDLTNSKHWYKATLVHKSETSDAAGLVQIAVDHVKKLFAVSVPFYTSSGSRKRSRKSKIRIFSPYNDNALATIDNQPSSAALLCVPEQRRFYALTEEAELYSIGPDLAKELQINGSPGISDAIHVSSQQTNQADMLLNIFGNDTKDKAITLAKDAILPESISIQKKFEWDEIPGVNLEQPFSLPKTSAIQLMSAIGVRS